MNMMMVKLAKYWAEVGKNQKNLQKYERIKKTSCKN